MDERHDQWNLYTTKGVRYKLVEGYPRGSYDGIVFNITEKIIIRVVDLHKFMWESYPTFTPYAENFVLEKNRAMPGAPMLFTRNVSFEPFIPGKPVDLWNIYGPIDDSNVSGEPRTKTFGDYLTVTIEYESMRLRTYLDVSCDSTAEFLMLAGTGGLTWTNASDVTEPADEIDISVNYIRPETTWNVGWPLCLSSYLPTLVDLCRKHLGKVNSLVMLNILYQAPVETMLFVGFSYREIYSFRSQGQAADVDTEGLENRNVSYLPPVSFEMKFLEKNFMQAAESMSEDDTQVTHNHFYRPKTGRFERLKRVDGTNIYETSNLNLLFGDAPQLQDPPSEDADYVTEGNGLPPITEGG